MTECEKVNTIDSIAIDYLTIRLRGQAFYVNNRVVLSEALSCDRLPDEILCSQQILARERSSRAYMNLNIKFPRGPITHRA